MVKRVVVGVVGIVVIVVTVEIVVKLAIVVIVVIVVIVDGNSRHFLHPAIVHDKPREYSSHVIRPPHPRPKA